MQLANILGDPNERALLMEVDDQAGVPLFAADYTPSGGGVEYIKPGAWPASGSPGRTVRGP